MDKVIADPRRLGGLAGMLGPALFVSVFVIEGFLRPDYDPVSTFISALSLGPHGWIQILNFLISGALIMLFARGVHAEFPNGKASKAGPILLALIGLGLSLSGPFVMDPMYTPADQMTWHGIVHGLLGAMVFTLGPIACIVFLRRFRADHEWQPLQWWTLVAAIILIVSIVLLRIASPPAPATNALVPYAGLIQRTLVITLLLWIFAFAFRLFKLNSETQSSAAHA